MKKRSMKRLLAWCITMALAIGIIYVPAVSVRAEGDDIELTMKGDIPTEPTEGKLEIAFNVPSGYSTLKSLADAGYTELEVTANIESYTALNGENAGAMAFANYKTDWGNQWFDLDGVGEKTFKLSYSTTDASELYNFGVQFANVSAISVTSASAKLIKTGSGSSGGGSSSGVGDTTEDRNYGDITYNYAKLLQESLYFYDANMCGPDVEKYTSVNWRKACHTNDTKATYKGQTVDVSGGFHDAGDHDKFGLPQGYSATVLGIGYYEFKEAFETTGQTEHLKKILDYFCDYFVRCTVTDSTDTAVAFCYQVGDGADHSAWVAAEAETINRPAYFADSSNPATDQVAEAVAALAMNYINFGDKDYLDCAKKLFNLAKSSDKATNSNEFYASSSWEDDYCLAAALLYKATNDNSYLEEYNKYKGEINLYGWPSWDQVGAYAVLYGEDSVSGLSTNVGNTLNGCKATSDGFTWLAQWGSNRYNANMQLEGLIYDKRSNADKYSTWANGQLKYMMGNNAKKQCYIVGYNPYSAKHPHHRSSSGYTDAAQNTDQMYCLIGALVGGMESSDGTYHDNSGDYTCNEVAIDYNAAFVGAVAAVYLMNKDDETQRIITEETADDNAKSVIKTYYGNPDDTTGGESGNTTEDPASSEETEESTDSTEKTEISTEASTEKTEASTESSTEASTEASTESSTEASTEASTESSTEASTEASTESSTEASTESSTEASTESSTEASTESSTEASTETSTEASTESSTEASTETSTEASTESSTEASTESTEKPDVPVISETPYTIDVSKITSADCDYVKTLINSDNQPTIKVTTEVSGIKIELTDNKDYTIVGKNDNAVIVSSRAGSICLNGTEIKKLSVENSTSVDIRLKGDNSIANGISSSSNGKIVIKESSNNATLKIENGCIENKGDISVEGGSLNIASSSKGIDTDGKFIISGGKLDIESNSSAIEADEITISGGEIKAESTGNTAAPVISATKDINLNGGTISATAKEGSGAKSFGVSSEGKICIDGAKVDENATFSGNLIDMNEQEHVHTKAEPVKKNIKEATCEENGSYDLITYCATCSEELEVKTYTIKCEGHDPKTPVKEDEEAASCDEDGSYFMVTYCKNCGEELEAVEHTIKKLGHKWDGGKVTKAATPVSTGTKTYTCTNSGCKETKTETIKKTAAPKKGTTLTYNGYKYKVTKSGTKNGTVSFIKQKVTKVTFAIPATIKVDGVTYKVTGVDENAFNGNKTVTSITLGSNIKSIGKNAFKGCGKLKQLNISTKLMRSSTLNKKAFAGLSKKVTVKVPASKLKSYKKLFVKCGLNKKIKIK